MPQKILYHTASEKINPSKWQQVTNKKISLHEILDIFLYVGQDMIFQRDQTGFKLQNKDVAINVNTK